MTTQERFQSWLKSDRPAPAEMMEGLHGDVKHLRLDKAGLEARGWKDVPKDWSPEGGELWAGGYMEDRSIYDSDVFTGDGEPRTVHLGVDVFAPAGTPVFAPIEGFLHSAQVNAGELDYGPTIILQHEMPDGLIFWTLYGHLSEDSMFGLEEGDLITAGEVLGELGGPEINGGWSPHVHFQVMLDLKGKSGDFPGVCKKSEADSWAAICPSPYELLGLKLT